MDTAHCGASDTTMKKKTYFLVCGAIAKEVLAVIEANKWTHLEVQALPAILHNHPDQIPERVDAKLTAIAGQYETVLVGYADCGTGGLLDPILEKHGAIRLPGPHCYSFFAGATVFDRIAGEEIGTFYLTDYLVRQFDTVVLENNGLGSLSRLVTHVFWFLSQTCLFGANS